MAQAATSGGDVMMEFAGNFTFNWTDEEKALLRRTLRVRVLREDRLEVETMGKFGRDLWFILLGHCLGFALVALFTLFATRIGSNGLKVSPILLAMMPFIAAGISFFVTMPFLPKQPSPCLTLFPDTPWCIGQGSLQPILELLEPASAEVLALRRTATAMPFCRHPDGPWLRTRFAVSDGAKTRCRDLILDRCKVLAATPAAHPPARVAGLVDPEVVRTPRDLYDSLRRHLNLMQLTSDTLVLRGGHWSWIWTGFVLLVDALVPIGATLVPGWAFEDYPVTLGDATSAPLWRSALLVLPWLPAVAQTVLVSRYYMRKWSGTVTFDKREDYILRQQGGRAVRIPTRECRVSMEPDLWEYEEPLTYSSIFLYHGHKVVARWVLEDPYGDKAGKALEAKVREYLDHPGD
jgi:membrane protein implicated in regulation of membrane protease activity